MKITMEDLKKANKDIVPLVIELILNLHKEYCENIQKVLTTYKSEIGLIDATFISGIGLLRFKEENIVPLESQMLGSPENIMYILNKMMEEVKKHLK